jgi:hypothetical protein
MIYEFKRSRKNRINIEEDLKKRKLKGKQKNGRNININKIKVLKD